MLVWHFNPPPPPPSSLVVQKGDALASVRVLLLGPRLVARCALCHVPWELHVRDLWALIYHAIILYQVSLKALVLPIRRSIKKEEEKEKEKKNEDLLTSKLLCVASQCGNNAGTPVNFVRNGRP